MNKSVRVISALLALASTQSFAAIVGFEGSSGVGNPIVTSYAESGYSFSSTHMHITGSPSVCIFGGCVASSSAQYLAEEAGSLGGPITMTHSSSVFSLLSFDAAELFLNDSAASSGGFQNAGIISVVGVKSDASTVFATFTLDGIKDGAGGVADFQTFFLPSSFTGLVSATFVGYVCLGLGAFGIDNINVAAVPEPSTVMLFLLGMTSLWYFRKKSPRV